MSVAQRNRHSSGRFARQRRRQRRRWRRWRFGWRRLLSHAASALQNNARDSCSVGTLQGRNGLG